MSNIKVPAALPQNRAVKFHPASSPIKSTTKDVVKPAVKTAPPLQKGDGSTPIKNPPALVKGGWAALPKPTSPSTLNSIPSKKDPELEEMLLHWPYPQTQIGTFKLGSIVKFNPAITEEVFQVGECKYAYAIVIGIFPKLILASRDAAGRWEEGVNFTRSNLLHCGEAKMQIYNEAKARLEK